MASKSSIEHFLRKISSSCKHLVPKSRKVKIKVFDATEDEIELRADFSNDKSSKMEIDEQISNSSGNLAEIILVDNLISEYDYLNSGFDDYDESKILAEISDLDSYLNTQN